MTLLRQRGMKTRHKATMVAMYVALERRGRGVGRMLAEAVIAHAREMPGLERVHATVVTTNTAARHLYHRVGFEAYGIELRALKHAGRAWDEELLVHELAPSAKSGRDARAGERGSDAESEIASDDGAYVTTL